MPPNEGAWQLNTDAQSRQDIDYIEAMIDDISSGHPVDASKVYAVGYSLGSMFSYELACQMSGRFAAIASFAGTMPVSPKSCDPERNVPIMHIHGVEDPIIAYGSTDGTGKHGTPSGRCRTYRGWCSSGATGTTVKTETPDRVRG